MADSSFIKPDPDTKSPKPVEEDDLYEDAGDLEFYNKTNNAFETLYLARVPRYMWDAWIKLTDKLGDDDEIQIGTLRTWNEKKPDGTFDVQTSPKTPLYHQTLIIQPDQIAHASRRETTRTPVSPSRVRSRNTGEGREESLHLQRGGSPWFQSAEQGSTRGCQGRTPRISSPKQGEWSSETDV